MLSLRMQSNCIRSACSVYRYPTLLALAG
jgi:hypothetical protein